MTLDTSVASPITVEDPANSIYADLLVDVFQEGYGTSFAGREQFAVSFLQLADCAVVLGELPDNVAAASLLRNTRITALGTRENRDIYGSRFTNLVNLSRLVRQIEPIAWTSIGIITPEVVRAASAEAGMTPSKNRDLLEKRLLTFGALSRYSIREGNDGLEIVLSTSSKGPEYWQAVWDWMS